MAEPHQFGVCHPFSIISLSFQHQFVHRQATMALQICLWTLQHQITFVSSSTTSSPSSIHHGFSVRFTTEKKNKKKQFTIRFTIDSRRFTSMHHSIHHAIHRSIRLNPHVQQMTPAICQASFSICAQVGETSDGLSTTQFPAAMAAMQGAKDRWKGKFQAPRTKTT